MSEALAWRIPEGRGRVSLRFVLIQIALASVVVGLLVLLLTPAENQQSLLSATIAMALALAAYQIWRDRREASGPANVWLDAAGLHWRDRSGAEQLLQRERVRGFLIGYDEETRRDRASLTLLLEGDFLSQPIELHEPADEARVKQWLTERWSIKEVAQERPLRFPLAIYSELDFQRQIWLLEGDRTELAALADILLKAADSPLPPVGARPKQWELDFEGEPLTLAISPHTWLDSGYFSASPDALRQLAEKIRQEPLPDNAEAGVEIELKTDSGHHWRIIVAQPEVQPQVE
jgi:hypothetical protein